LGALVLAACTLTTQPAPAEHRRLPVKTAGKWAKVKEKSEIKDEKDKQYADKVGILIKGSSKWSLGEQSNIVELQEIDAEMRVTGEILPILKRNLDPYPGNPADACKKVSSELSKKVLSLRKKDAELLELRKNDAKFLELRKKDAEMQATMASLRHQNQIMSSLKTKLQHECTTFRQSEAFLRSEVSKLRQQTRSQAAIIQAKAASKVRPKAGGMTISFRYHDKQYGPGPAGTIIPKMMEEFTDYPNRQTSGTSNLRQFRKDFPFQMAEPKFWIVCRRYGSQWVQTKICSSQGDDEIEKTLSKRLIRAGDTLIGVRTSFGIMKKNGHATKRTIAAALVKNLNEIPLGSDPEKTKTYPQKM